MKIGFIGLVIMGKPMAKNLINAGYSLVVNDLLPNSPHVREALLCADGVIDGAGAL